MLGESYSRVSAVGHTRGSHLRVQGRDVREMKGKFSGARVSSDNGSFVSGKGGESLMTRVFLLV